MDLPQPDSKAAEVVAFINEYKEALTTEEVSILKVRFAHFKSVQSALGNL